MTETKKMYVNIELCAESLYKDLRQDKADGKVAEDVTVERYAADNIRTKVFEQEQHFPGGELEGYRILECSELKVESTSTYHTTGIESFTKPHLKVTGEVTLVKD